MQWLKDYRHKGIKNTYKRVIGKRRYIVLMQIAVIHVCLDEKAVLQLSRVPGDVD